jgi:hypothetical protein
MSLFGKFPVFEQAAEATCFNCHGELSRIKVSTFADEYGKWSGYCEACSMLTWFDLEGHKS